MLCISFDTCMHHGHGSVLDRTFEGVAFVAVFIFIFKRTCLFIFLLSTKQNVENREGRAETARNQTSPGMTASNKGQTCTHFLHCRIDVVEALRTARQLHIFLGGRAWSRFNVVSGPSRLRRSSVSIRRDSLVLTALYFFDIIVRLG